MKRTAAFLGLLVLLAPAPARAEEGVARLGRAVRELASILDSRQERFTLRAEVTVGGETVRGRYVRRGADAFELAVDHPRYGFRLTREAKATRLYLPRHDAILVGEGEAPEADSLAPPGSIARLVSDRTQARRAVRWAGDLYALANLSDATAGRLVAEVLDLTPGEAPGTWTGHGGLTIELPAPGRIRVRGRGFSLVVSVEAGADAAPAPPVDGADAPVRRAVDRAEMERAISRGVRRALEVLWPAPAAASADATAERETAHGRLLFVKGQRVALLSGTPEEIGRAHAALLGEEARLCLDSTVHMTGLAYTLEKGRWFLDDLRAAYARLAPHIPERHRREMDALADGLGVDRELVRIANVFPELFHCSGFAVFGSATADGKLYHGRVLDYMTEIGLQDCMTVFVVAPEGRRRFVNVGYAGFVGSVSGMNEAGVSLGEMGGRGEGNWDGVPMATLMRRALEECGTLHEVIDLWRESPRTCEYYYVFADGKIPDAVGVAATPEKLEVIRAGEDHPLLGEGIPDAVVLSAGSRLEELRRRVRARHGRIGVEDAIRFMDRPVAMRSNLHDVLFVPGDLVLWFAGAGHGKPACEMPYVRLDLRALFGLMPE